MHQLMMTPPHSTLEPVTDVFHGVPVTDPYRWREDQDSPVLSSGMRSKLSLLKWRKNMQISENVRAMINQDGGILMDIEHGVMISLNVSASQVWKKLQQNIPPDQIIGQISAEFEISPETARRDVQEFLDCLQKHALLKVDSRESR